MKILIGIVFVALGVPSYAHPITNLFEVPDYNTLVKVLRKMDTRSEEGRVAFYWGCLAIESLRGSQPPPKVRTRDPKSPDRFIMMPDPYQKEGQSFPMDVFDRAFALLKQKHTGGSDQVMQFWASNRVIEPNSPPFPEYGFRIVSWAKPPPNSNERPMPVWGLPPEFYAERTRQEKAWHDRKDRFPELIVYRIYNEAKQPPVSESDLNWLASSTSPFRPIAVAELRVREGKSGKPGPWTARWSTWVSQNKGILRDLLVRRVKRLLNPIPPKPSSSSRPR